MAKKTAERHAAKKTAVLGGKKTPLPIVLVSAVVVLIGALVYVYGFMGKASTAEVLQAPAKHHRRRSGDCHTGSRLHRRQGASLRIQKRPAPALPAATLRA